MAQQTSPVAEKREYRKEVVAFLQLIASFDRQENADLGVPPEDVPAELCRFWFDDIYLPSENYFDAPKGDISAEAVSDFEASFSDDDLLALARFHRFLELRLEMLPEVEHRFKCLYESELWEDVMKDAQNTLELLEV